MHQISYFIFSYDRKKKEYKPLGYETSKISRRQDRHLSMRDTRMLK